MPRFATTIIVSNVCGENLTATRKSANSDDDDDFPDIDELLSGIMQKESPASADPNSDDDDGFIDIDDFLSDIQQKSIPASANPNSGGMAEKVDNGTRGDSPVGSSRSTVGSTQGEHTAFLQFNQDFLLIRSQTRLY